MNLNEISIDFEAVNKLEVTDKQGNFGEISQRSCEIDSAGQVVDARFSSVNTKGLHAVCLRFPACPNCAAADDGDDDDNDDATDDDDHDDDDYNDDDDDDGDDGDDDDDDDDDDDGYEDDDDHDDRDDDDNMYETVGLYKST
ncbi:hypothetical protein ElyMa_001137000 [Elysia marginata]|uniref:Uncharacterized protein n=1 Tax=Elysia marginata TaxID=1093978 RepID=A0AAV4HXT4_9GAST|nr:hypothetical protein ElyMa_001137000 [Elysia marginata]